MTSVRSNQVALRIWRGKNVILISRASSDRNRSKFVALVDLVVVMWWSAVADDRLSVNMKA